MTFRPRTLHRASATVLALFIFLHLLNHLALAAGSDVHLLVMSGLRAVYRTWWGEAALLACVGAQIYSGITLALPRLRGVIARRDWQLLSGLYLAVFLAIHISAILWGRIYFGLDTNLWFGAAGFHVWPWPLFFVPYYGLAIICFAAHVGFALQRLTGIKALLPATLLGFLSAMLIVLLMWGKIVEMQVPTDYLNSYQ